LLSLLKEVQARPTSLGKSPGPHASSAKLVSIKRETSWSVFQPRSRMRSAHATLTSIRICFMRSARASSVAAVSDSARPIPMRN
jgi:hypothetical protein